MLHIITLTVVWQVRLNCYRQLTLKSNHILFTRVVFCFSFWTSHCFWSFIFYGLVFLFWIVLDRVLSTNGLWYTIGVHLNLFGQVTFLILWTFLQKKIGEVKIIHFYSFFISFSSFTDFLELFPCFHIGFGTSVRLIFISYSYYILFLPELCCCLIVFLKKSWDYMSKHSFIVI